MAALELPLRYYRLGADPGQRTHEATCGHVEITWSVPTAEAALVLVDCWHDHYIVSHEERSGQIIRERVAPVAEACRQAGVTVIHAPSPTSVELYPQWLQYAGDSELGFVARTPADDWPPAEFRQRTGEYAAYARPPERVIHDWVENRYHYRISEHLQPQEGDFVVATGAQLHRLLKHRKVLHLIYAGFAANMCVPYRDYGMRAMKDRGYSIILLRDCTSAIEAAETLPDFSLTRAAVLNTEMTVGHTTTSEALIGACAVEG